MTTAKAVLGVLAGVAAGAALGVLFAPDKGSVTRKRISKKTAYVADSLEDLADSMEERIDRKFEDLLHAVNAKVRTFKTQADAEMSKRPVS